VETLYEEITAFVTSAIGHVTTDEQVLSEICEITSAALQKNKKAASEELERIWQDERQQPITYNHYYTDNVQNARQDSTRKMIRKAMDETTTHDWNGRLHVSNNTIDTEKLLASLQRRIIVDMEEQACAEALAGLSAYYKVDPFDLQPILTADLPKVALKTFVDNVCRQIIERHLLSTLSAIFCPETVASFGDEDLKRIAAELPGNAEKRKGLRELHCSLEQSLRDLRR